MQPIAIAFVLLAQGAEGPLAGLPGGPGPHVEHIQKLSDNSWHELGAPEKDPTWGRARGRSWTTLMPYAPELQGAFLFGEGVHGYTKPGGRYMDDLWFYDVLGHRWICCYPGADTKTLDLRLNADGFESAADGRPIPVASQVHGYQMNTYDPHLRRFMSMPNPHGYEKKALPQREKWVKPPPSDASPWMFDSATGKWSRTRTGTPAPKSGFGDTFHYVPSLRKAFFAHGSKEVALYDPAANTWEKPAVSGPPPPFGIDATSCVDTRRERIYIGGGSYPVAPEGTNAFRIYDLKKNEWIDPKPKGAPCRGSNSYPTKNALMIYDPLQDKVLLLLHTAADDKAERIGIYVYDPEANAWAGEALAVAEKLARDRRPKNGFYNPDLNAVFIHSAGDSNDDGVIWVYRYKREAK